MLQSSPNDDEDMEINNPFALQRALRSTDNTLNQKNLSGAAKQSKNNVLNPDMFSKLQEIAQLPETPSENNAILDATDFEDDYEDSIFLDGDAYMKASYSVNADGSLPAFLFDDEEENPYADFMGDTQDASLKDLLKAVEKRSQDGKNDEQAAKAMHDDILADEQPFTRQSQAFLDGLGGDAEAAESAKAQRRQKQFQKYQSKYQSKLDQELEDWSSVLEHEQIAKEQPSNSLLKNESQQDPLANKGSTSDWVAVDDPSTGEQFYWNRKTGEMKLDLDWCVMLKE